MFWLNQRGFKTLHGRSINYIRLADGVVSICYTTPVPFSLGCVCCPEKALRDSVMYVARSSDLEAIKGVACRVSIMPSLLSFD